MVITMTLFFGDGSSKEVRALIDSGAEVNAVSQRLVAELNWTTRKNKPSEAKSVDGHRIFVWGEYRQRAVIADSWEVERDEELVFSACNIEDFDVILGYPWLRTVHIDFANKAFKWRSATDDTCEIMSAKRFVKMLNHEPTVPLFAAYLTTSGVAIRVLSKGTAEAPTVPQQYADFADVFDEKAAAELPPIDGPQHAIELQPGAEPTWGPVYPLAAKEMEVLREYLEDRLERGWIRRSKSPAGAPVLFAPKKDGGLRLCIDYRSLNKLTIKNRTPLPLISETMDRLGGAAIFTKLDLKDAYNRIRIQEGDEWKTAFRTRYGHFEYTVMPFGLCNAPATFQSYINEALAGLVDVFCVVYLDDILVYSEREEDHPEHVRQVLERLRQYKLYANLKKCHFNTKEVEFLGFIISTKGVTMEPQRIAAIVEWPEPTCVRDVQVFLGFANFYRRFIRKYSHVASPLTDLTRKGSSFHFTSKARAAFQHMKRLFTEAPVLRHFDPSALLRVETDASVFAVGAVLSQLHGTGADARWYPIAYFSRKMSLEETRYETHDQELLAIVESFRVWRQYLSYATDTVEVVTDHNNLTGFMAKEKLNRRQVRWAQTLAEFDFQVSYRPGKNNPADGPSRRPDHNEGSPDTGVDLLPSLKKKLEGVPQLNKILLSKSGTEIMVLQKTAGRALCERRQLRLKAEIRDLWTGLSLGAGMDQQRTTTQEGPGGVRVCSIHTCEDVNPAAGADGCKRYVPRAVVGAMASPETALDDLPAESMTDLIGRLQQRDAFVTTRRWESIPKRKRRAGEEPLTWKVDPKGLLRVNGQAYVSDDPAVRAEIMLINHDDPAAGHFGAKKTLELIKRKYFWFGMRADVKKWCRQCPVCQRSKTRRHRPYGLLKSLEKATQPWKDLSMDFITDLPPSNYDGKVYDSIFVVVDRYTKMVRYVPCNKTITAPQMAQLFVDHVVRHFGTPDTIVSDRGPQFTSHFWSSLCFYLRVRRRLSTAFHPQTDGQTEVQNQTIEHYLRVYCSYRQDDWASKLQLAEFTYNASTHSTTGVEPFRVMYGYVPEIHVNVEDDVTERKAIAAHERAKILQQERDTLDDQWKAAMEAQARFYNAKRKPQVFKLNQKVMLSAKNIRVARPNRKLSDKYVGPFEITKVLSNGMAYELRLPPTWKIHNVFHVSLLEPYEDRGDNEPEPPPPELMDEHEEWQVETILDHRDRKNGRQYLVRWLGFTPADDTWEPSDHLENAMDLVQAYERAVPAKVTTAQSARFKRVARRRTLRGKPMEGVTSEP